MRNPWNGVTLLAVLLLAACSDAGREGPAAAASGARVASAPAEAVSAVPSVSKAVDDGGAGQGRGKGPEDLAGQASAAASVPASAVESAPPVLSPEAQAKAEKQLWLESPLYGSDNHMARARRVTISPSGDGYRVLIANQWSFECDLAFNSRGQPARMTRCAPSLPENSEWTVVQKTVALHCTTRAAEVVCSGEYDLGMPAGGTFPGRMTIARKR